MTYVSSQDLKGQPWFGELVDNILLVVDFFNKKVDKVREQAGDAWLVDKVLGVVQEAAKSWRPDMLRLFPELRFTYEEEASPEEFFVPYVWSLVVGQRGHMGASPGCHRLLCSRNPPPCPLRVGHDLRFRPAAGWDTGKIQLFQPTGAAAQVVTEDSAEGSRGGSLDANQLGGKLDGVKIGT